MPYKKHKQYRVPGYDYSSNGDYFITVCTKSRKHYFGKIIKTNSDALIELTPIGSFVKDSILSIPDTYTDIALGETVVMPNHIHAIVSLPVSVRTGRGLFPQGLFPQGLFLPEQSPLQKTMSPNKGLAPLTPGSVSSIINHLKGKVKKWCNANGYADFDWQTRFHDHIIRNIGEYTRISNYIANNIWNWKEDENNDGGNNFRPNIRT